MKRLVLRNLLLLLTAVAFAFGGWPNLAAAEQLHWYRGNLHTHSLWSDGNDYPEVIAR